MNKISLPLLVCLDFPRSAIVYPPQLTYWGKEQILLIGIEKKKHRFLSYCLNNKSHTISCFLMSDNGFKFLNFCPLIN